MAGVTQEENKRDALQKIKRTLSGEYWESVEIPIHHKDGGTRIALWNSANIYDKEGKNLNRDYRPRDRHH
jgi:hypothetical protein